MTNKRRKPTGSVKLLPLKMNYNNLVDCAQFALSRSSAVTLDSLTLAYTLFSSIDKSLYNKDIKSLMALEFVILALRARVVDKINKRALIVQYCIDNNTKYKEEYEALTEEIDKEPITPRELDFVMKYISKQMALAAIISNKDHIQEVIDKFDSKDYSTPDEILADFATACTGLIKGIRDSQIERSDTTLDTSRADFKTKIKSAVTELRQKGNRLNTGIIALNQMTNGGFENKRVYTFAAPPSGGKSLLALNMALTVKEHNEGPDMVQPDGSIPTILFITHENTVTETIERLYGVLVSGDPMHSSDISDDVITETISKTIMHDPEVPGSINIHLHYMPSNQHNVRDLDLYIDKLEDEGKKVIFVIHDYIKKIRPNVVTNETRLDIAQVVDDFKSISLLRNIPTMLLTQISRAGAGGMEEALKRNNPDALKDSSRTVIGESWGIVENSDWLSIVLKVPNIINGQDMGSFMSFLNTKARNGNQNMHHFFQPFSTETPLKLLSDVGGKPLGQKSMLVSFDELEKITDEEVERGKEELKQDLLSNGKLTKKKKKSESSNSLEDILFA
ncbi:MAG: DnaB family ATPase [Paraclostridium sp.]